MATKRIGSISFGKDSTAMLFMLIEKGYPLDEVVFYNSGMEFKALYDIRDKILPVLENYNIKYTELLSEYPFTWNMLERPVKKRGTDIIHKYGYSWCGGGLCRWGTSQKLQALRKHIKDNYYYVGLAADEEQRFHKEDRWNRILPLRDWNIIEREALQYCYDLGFTWEENGVRLYDILDRVSCFCCGFKNLKELKNIYMYLPSYWYKLKYLQSKTDRPFRKNGETIHDLEKRFESELQREPIKIKCKV